MANYLTLFINYICILAILVSIIIEMTKKIKPFKLIPTDLQVITTSLILCLISYFAYVSYTNSPVLWYMITGMIITSFFVSYVSMYGWEKLHKIIIRYNLFDKEYKSDINSKKNISKGSKDENNKKDNNNK